MHIADKIRAKSQAMTDVQYAGLVIVLLPAAWLIAIAWPFMESWRAKYDLEEMPPEANLIVVMGSLALPHVRRRDPAPARLQQRRGATAPAIRATTTSPTRSSAWR